VPAFRSLVDRERRGTYGQSLGPRTSVTDEVGHNLNEQELDPLEVPR